MPKIIDAEERRQRIADALFAVLREQGFQAVSLATIAEGAGLAIGSVRHFTGSRQELLTFAFRAHVERIQQRILSRADRLVAELQADTATAEARLQATAELLTEFLPLDEARLAESIVWVEFEAAARTDAQLAPESERAAAQVRALLERILISAQDAGGIAEAADIGLEADRLSALLDGLTLRATLHPTILPPERAREVILAHLRTLQA